jgi:6-phosphogluconolactonase
MADEKAQSGRIEMSVNGVENHGEGLGKASRRTFLKGAAALAVGSSLARGARGSVARSGRATLAYVGSYSSPQGPEGSRGNGEGIYLFEVDPSTGALTQREVFRNGMNPSWITFNPARTHLYSSNETQTYNGKASGAISAYAIERPTGRLKLLNTVSSEGAGPAYMSIHPSGKYALVANYAAGTVAVIAIGRSGELGLATYVHHDRGAAGAKHASSAPPGSFAISGHGRPHAHMIHADPSGRYVLSTDLGMDKIFVWKFDAEKGTLAPHQSVSLPTGDGPRHFAFHPNGRWVYSAQEEASTLTFFEYDGPSGRLTRQGAVSTLPKGFAGTNFASEIRVSSDGRFVYVGNRLHDSTAFFSIGADGAPTFAGEAWTRGDYPRSFNFDPTGNFLYSCNQRADAITTFHVHRETGGLTFTGRYTPVGTPSCIIFLPL